MWSPQPKQPDRLMLWIDAVGGFWVCLADTVTLGQSDTDGEIDVPIFGDLSRRHARIRRDGEGYLVEAIGLTRVDGRRVGDAAPLRNGSRIELGDRVRLVFRRPHALSATARLDFVSHHRTRPSSDAVLLMADSCILGPGARCHVVCRDWPQEVILYQHDGQLFCRTAGTLEIDGKTYRNRGPLLWNSRVAGDGFSLNLEVLSSSTP